eukprot:TRINITY_DN13107_c0_g1_i1.p1 TRINITY_DN13107_c0_g1~~TRINITY_DN13107_c0_g1_i1.p1  ORF type:complete len:609 (-),score=117.10 TRINITY_DN13107_c0_g1_i1:10-1836(-)
MQAQFFSSFVSLSPPTLCSAFNGTGNLVPFSVSDKSPCRFVVKKLRVNHMVLAETKTGEQRSMKRGSPAKSPGRIYREKALSNAVSEVSVPVKSRKKLKSKGEIEQGENEKRKQKKIGFQLSSGPTCYGCGAPFQTVEAEGPGYLAPDVYALKRKHRQLNSVLCQRCRLLSHGHMLTAVGGHGGYPGGKQFVFAEQLREKLSYLRHQKALIIKLVDIVDFNGSFLTRVRELVGANPIILVATKVDLLPKGTDLNAVGDWIVEAVLRKKLNVLSIHLTSSKSLSGFVGVASEIQKQRKGRDVYVLGSANVGKSAFIDALLKTMSIKNFELSATRRYKPVQSAVPGTTLGPIAIDAFAGERKLYDTPGVHLHHRQAAVVNAEDLSFLAPQSQLKGCVVSIETLNRENQKLFTTLEEKSFNEFKAAQLSREPELEGEGCPNLHCNMNGLSVFWGGLARIDMTKIYPRIRLVLYGPKSIKIKVVPTSEADKFYEKELGEALRPPTAKSKESVWPGLNRVRSINRKFEHKQRPVCDIAISGLGWILIEPDQNSGVYLGKPAAVAEELQFEVHVPKPVEIFVRSPMPVGKHGSSWYEYSELTEKEEETRPKIYY